MSSKKPRIGIAVFCSKDSLKPIRSQDLERVSPAIATQIILLSRALLGKKGL